MATSEQLPNDLAAMVDAALEPGEQIVWTGQPRTFHIPIVSVAVIGLGLLLWMGVFLIAGGSNIAQLVFLYGAFVCWIAIPWLTVSGIRQRRMLRRTCYVITDRRAIAFEAQRRGGYRVFVNLPEDLANVRCVTRFGSFGGITWIESTGSRFNWLVGRYCGGFIAIDRAREVLQRMYDTFLPLVASRLDDPDPDVRRKAASAIAKIGSSAGQALPQLVAALESDDSFVRDRAAYTLGQLGQSASSAVPALKRTLLIDESRQVAETARTAITEIQPLSP